MMRDFIQIVQDYMYLNEVRKIDSDYAHEVMTEELHSMLDKAIEKVLQDI